jgi:hypothetical protein
VPPSSYKLYDSAGNPFGTVQDILTTFVREMQRSWSADKRVMEEYMTRTIETPTFLKTTSQLLPFIKIESLSATVTLTTRDPLYTPLKLANMVNYILRNLNDNKEQIIEVDKSPKASE